MSSLSAEDVINLYRSGKVKSSDLGFVSKLVFNAVTVWVLCVSSPLLWLLCAFVLFSRILGKDANKSKTLRSRVLDALFLCRGALTCAFLVVRAGLQRVALGPLRPGWPFKLHAMAAVVRHFGPYPIPTIRRFTGLLQKPAFTSKKADVREEWADRVPIHWIAHKEAVKEDGSFVVFYLHGGGYALGSRVEFCNIAYFLSKLYCAEVAAVEYRLAPENPYPAAIEDALLAYRHVVRRTKKKVVIAGDSAGAGLAIVLLTRIRDLELQPPVGAVLLSPWVDLRCAGPSYDAHNSADYICNPACQMVAKLYARGAQTGVAHPEVSPILADLRGLPPLLCVAGGSEVFVFDIAKFAHKASESGVDCTFYCEEDMPHVHSYLRTVVPEDAVKRTNSKIREVVHKWVHGKEPFTAGHHRFGMPRREESSARFSLADATAAT